MYNLIRTDRGKDTVLMTDSIKRVNARLKTLRAGSRKSGRSSKNYTYRVESTEDTEKFKKKPHDRVW